MVRMNQMTMNSNLTSSAPAGPSVGNGAPMGGALSIRNVSKIYDPEGVNVCAVNDCSMEIAAGKPKATQGADRMVVFQNGALFPWKTLVENVAYGPIVQKRLSKAAAREKAQHMLAEAGLGDFGDKYPGEVSSGMARRAEIVRALINEPKVLLLDEPYRAMDALTKSIMHESLLETYDRTKVTIFFITHDLEEAIFLGDKVHIVTTRPCSLKKTVDVTIRRPRNYESLSSETFRRLMGEVNEAVHEEAVKAFQAGERELA